MSREDQLIRTGFGVLTESAPPAPSFDELGDQPQPLVRPNDPRRFSKALIPILAAVAVLVAIGVPSLLLGGNDGEHVGNTPSEPTLREGLFFPNLGEWVLVAMLRFVDEPDVGVYRGPLPDAVGEVTWINGEREFWPPRDRDGNPLLLFRWNSNELVELHERPYALIGGGLATMADPLDLLGATSDGRGITVLERAERVDIVDQAGWEDFLAEVESSRQAREPDGN